jgi:hypothetical protein
LYIQNSDVVEGTAVTRTATVNGVPVILPTSNVRNRQQNDQHQPQDVSSSAKCA